MRVCVKWWFGICMISTDPCKVMQHLLSRAARLNLFSVCVHIQLSTAVTVSQQSELTHSVTATVTKVTTREKVSAVRQPRESPPPQKKRQVVVDSELRKRWVCLATWRRSTLNENEYLSTKSLFSNLCEMFSYMHPFLLSYLGR